MIVHQHHFWGFHPWDEVQASEDCLAIGSCRFLQKYRISAAGGTASGLGAGVWGSAYVRLKEGQN